MPLDKHRALPACPAVYFALSESGEVLYIGRSLNLSRRWLTHHLLGKLREVGNVRIAWMEISELGLFAEIESALINHFQPRLNIAHKWVGRKKSVNFTNQELEELAQASLQTGRTETEIIREALRSWLANNRNPTKAS